MFWLFHGKPIKTFIYVGPTVSACCALIENPGSVSTPCGLGSSGVAVSSGLQGIHISGHIFAYSVSIQKPLNKPCFVDDDVARAPEDSTIQYSMQYFYSMKLQLGTIPTDRVVKVSTHFEVSRDSLLRVKLEYPRAKRAVHWSATCRRSGEERKENLGGHTLKASKTLREAECDICR